MSKVKSAHKKQIKQIAKTSKRLQTLVKAMDELIGKGHSLTTKLATQLSRAEALQSKLIFEQKEPKSAKKVTLKQAA